MSNVISAAAPLRAIVSGLSGNLVRLVGTCNLVLLGQNPLLELAIRAAKPLR